MHKMYNMFQIFTLFLISIFSPQFTCQSTPDKHVKTTAEIIIESEEIEKKIAPIRKLLKKIRPSCPRIGNEKKGEIAGLVQGIARDAIKAELLSEKFAIKAELLSEKLRQVEFEKKTLNDQLIKAKEDLKKESLMISIRSKIEFWEDMLAPNYKFIGKQNDITAYVNFHKERWMWTIENSSDPTVKKMNEFIKKNLNNDIDLFCTRIAGFFTYTSRSDHTPPLHEYNVEEVDKIMRSKFNINDDITLGLVHFFMKT